jgi:hypothetical protein
VPRPSLCEFRLAGASSKPSHPQAGFLASCSSLLSATLDAHESHSRLLCTGVCLAAVDQDSENARAHGIANKNDLCTCITWSEYQPVSRPSTPWWVIVEAPCVYIIDLFLSLYIYTYSWRGRCISDTRGTKRFHGSEMNMPNGGNDPDSRPAKMLITLKQTFTSM